VTAKRKTKSVPIALSWHGTLRRAELPDEYPSRVAIIAVGSVMFGHADADGTHSRPSITTIMREAGVSQRTARLVLACLVDLGWLAVTAKANQRRATEYRLTFAKGVDGHPLVDAQRMPTGTPSDELEDADEHPLVDAQRMPTGTPCDELGDALGDAVGDAVRHPDLSPPSNNEEEDEGTAAPSTHVSGAVPLPAVDPTARELDELVDELDASVHTAIGGITHRAGVSIDTRRLGPAIVAAMERTGWPVHVVAVYCIERLKRQGRRVHNPTGWLVTDLGRVDGHVVPSPRMQLADSVARFVKVATASTAVANQTNHPTDRLKRLLNDANLGDDQGRPRVFEVKAADIEKVKAIVDRVIREYTP